MWYTTRMLKQIILIAALVPGTVAAHTFDQHRWAQTWLKNRVNIGECLLLSEINVPAFLKTCDLDAMVTIENAQNRALEAQMLHHPGYTEIEFIAEHFAERDDEYIWGMYLNIEATPQFASILVRLYVTQGLTQNSGAVYVPQGNASTVDE